MLEQPVALACSIRVPKSWLIMRTYGVSPQPAQAPLKANSGCVNCSPLGEVLTNLGSVAGRAW